MFYIIIFLFLICIAMNLFFYRKICRLMEYLAFHEKPVHMKAEKSVKPEEKDDKETNDERRYLEGINAVLSYDISTMKDYIKGVSEE